MPCLHEVCTAVFLFKAFQPLLFTNLHTVVLGTLILLSWSILFTLQSCWSITHILTAFSITFFTQFAKKPATYFLVCLVRSLLLTTCSLVIVQTSGNNLTICLTKWTEYRKNRCLSSSTNSVRLHFRERVETTKENPQKSKIDTYKMGRKNLNMEGKNSRASTFGEKNEKNIIISSNFSLKFLWTVI